MREPRGNSLLVRNLKFSTSVRQVRSFFESFGQVRDVYLPLDYYSRLPRGFGFVEFYREEDAEAALAACQPDISLGGARITVTVAQQGRKSPDSMRTRDKDDRTPDRRRRSRSPYDDRHRQYSSRNGNRYHDYRRHSYERDSNDLRGRRSYERDSNDLRGRRSYDRDSNDLRGRHDYDRRGNRQYGTDTRRHRGA